MKNILFATISLFFMLCCTHIVNAQHLPSAGDKTFEITVSPLNNTPVTFNEFRLRSFQSSDTALRLRGNILYSSERMDEDSRDARFDISLAPGKEWHAWQNERISVYYGAELPLRYVASRQHRVDFAGDDVTNKNNQGGEHFGIGLNAIAGFDIHFLDFLYTGVEVRYGLMFRTYLDLEVGGNVIDNDARDLAFGNSAVGRFRLGITF